MKERVKSLRQELTDFNTNVDIKISILENQLRPDMETLKSETQKLSEDLSAEIEVVAQQLTRTMVDLATAAAVNRNQTRILTRVGDKTNDLEAEFTKQGEQFSQLLTTVRSSSNFSLLWRNSDFRMIIDNNLFVLIFYYKKLTNIFTIKITFMNFEHKMSVFDKKI